MKITFKYAVKTRAKESAAEMQTNQLLGMLQLSSGNSCVLPPTGRNEVLQLSFVNGQLEEFTCSFRSTLRSV